MTPEQIRVAVAEELGWRMVEGTLAFPPKTLIDEWLASLPKEQADQVMAVDYCEIPNYDSDLNACHEMEKSLTNEQIQRYSEQLSKIVVPLKALFPPFVNPPATRYIWHATPIQRCEAFLRVRNKWRDK